MADLESKNDQNKETLPPVTTCYSCAYLTGEIVKDESVKKTVLIFQCLLKNKTSGPEKEVLWRFEIPTLSVDGRLPNSKEYPNACDNYRG